MTVSIGRYEIIRELGRGGMATVFLARDPSVQREVAIKVLPREFMHDPQFLARFEREAHIIAQLEHPAIVPVYDFGKTEDGQPYIVMRYMAGGSLADRMKQGRMALPDAAHLFSPLAGALDKAHGKGIVHRDLKPGNILFDEYGNPHIADFGIAKMQQGNQALTNQQTVGTPAYMSPEQAQGLADIDGRSDIYALGVILFELLTGQPPYQSETAAGQMIKHITAPVPSPSRVHPDLPQQCDSVILRALAKQPTDRYATARLLATDLAAVAKVTMPPNTPSAGLPRPGQTVNDMPTRLTPPPQTPSAVPPAPHAGPPSWVWGAGFGLVVVLVVLLVVAVAVIVWQAARASLPPAANTATAEVIVITASPAPVTPPTSRPELTPTAFETALPTAAPPPATPATFPINVSNVGEVQLLRTLTGHADSVTSAAFSPDGQWVLSGGYDKTARVWRVADGVLVRTLNQHSSTVFAVAFTPDGKQMLVGSNDGTISIWETATGDLVKTLKVTSVLGMRFSPRGDMLGVAGLNGNVYLFQTSNWELLNTLTGHTEAVYGVAFLTNGALVASASDDDTVRVTGIDGQNKFVGLPAEPTAGETGLLSVSFSPDGELVLAGGRNGLIRVWRVSDGKLITLLDGHTSWVSGLAFSPDGNLLASSSYDGSVVLWDWEARTVVATLRPKVAVLSVAFSNDGTMLVTAQRDKTVQVWGLER